MGQIELFDCSDFGHCPESRRPFGNPAKTRARANPLQRWALEDHVCRHCFGRLVSTGLGSGRSLYRCTNCGAEADGHHAEALCVCGLQVRSTAPGGHLVNAGLRCQPNPSPNAEFPSQIVAAEART